MCIRDSIIVGIGNAAIRKKIQEMIPMEKLVTLIHPDAVIAEDVVIGVGTVVMAGAVVNPCLLYTSGISLEKESMACPSISADRSSWRRLFTIPT